MILLLAFSFLAGAGTAVTPCVLPVLPALLSASGSGGRRRPLGVVAGLTVTHVIAIVALASVIQGVGLADGFVRTLAVFVLLAFGLALLLPRLGERLERPLARLTALGPRSGGSGFWSGLGVGGALGFVYAPCAGPILAAVVSVSASQGTTAELVALAIAYGLGSAAVLLLLALGGRRLMDRFRRAGARLRPAAHARGDHGHHGHRGRDRPRRPLPDRAGQRLPRPPDQPDAGARAVGRGGERAGRVARRAAL